MSEFFGIYALLALIMMALVMVIRHRLSSWAWNLALILLLLFAGLFKITGTPRDAVFFSTIERMHGDVEVLYQGLIPKKFIYLLIRRDPSEKPYLIEIAWTKELEQQIRAAQMKAVERQTPLLVNIDKMSKWRIPTPPPLPPLAGKQAADEAKKGDGKGFGQKQGGDQMFYPKPVTGDPDKNQTHSIIIDRDGSIPGGGMENPE